VNTAHYDSFIWIKARVEHKLAKIYTLFWVKNYQKNIQDDQDYTSCGSVIAGYYLLIPHNLDNSWNRRYSTIVHPAKILERLIESFSLVLTIHYQD